MSKRKRVVLNFQQKLEILQQLQRGRSGAVLAKEYGIGTSTISDIKRNSEAIVQFVSNLECEDQISEKKTRKTAQNTDLDSRIHRWYLEERRNGVSPPDMAICAKALEINKQLTNGSENFKASSGWLRQFKNRHNIKDDREEVNKSTGEVDVGKQLKSMYKRGGYFLENVYNVDYGFLLWKSLPNYDRDQDDLMIIACANANGSHRLPLYIIGNDKDYKSESDSVIYHAYKKNRSFIEHWFKNIFIVEVKTRQQNTGTQGKILLVINPLLHEDLSSHLNSDVGIYPVPVDFNLLNLQMESPIKQLKLAYRKQLLELFCSKSLYPIKQFLEEFTLNESIPVISEAWNSIPRTHIVQSWTRLLSEVKNEPESIHDRISEIAAIAQKIRGLEHCRSEDITQWLESDKEHFFFNTTEIDGKEDQEDEIEEGPSTTDAYHAIETITQWLMKQEDCTRSQLASAEKIREMITSKMCTKFKQEKE